MGIKFYCPNGHKLNVKSFLAGKRGICPHCGAKVDIPAEPAEATIQGTLHPGGVYTAPNGNQQQVGGPTQVPTGPQVHSVPTGAPAGQFEHPQYTVPSGVDAMPPTGGHGIGPTPQSYGAGFAPPGSAPGGGTIPMGQVPGGQVPGGQVPGGQVPGGQFVGGAAPAGGAYGGVQGAPQAAPATPAISDPIAEAPHAVWYVRPPSGGQYGPATGDIMRRWITEGRVSADSQVWREGWADWQPAGPVFADLLPGARSATHNAPADYAPAPTSPRSTPTRAVARRRNDNLIAILVVVFLAILSVILLGGLIVVATMNS